MFSILKVSTHVTQNLCLLLKQSEYQFSQYPEEAQDMSTVVVLTKLALQICKRICRNTCYRQGSR